MGIYKNIELDGTKGVTVAEFGGGTIQVITCDSTVLKLNGRPEYRGLLLRSCEPKEIGEAQSIPVDSFKPELALIFRNKESFAVFRKAVNCIFIEQEVEETELPSRQIVLDTVSDLVSCFTYEDRKEDEDLSEQHLEDIIKNGTVSIDEIVQHFRNELEKAYENI